MENDDVSVDSLGLRWVLVVGVASGTWVCVCQLVTLESEACASYGNTEERNEQNDNINNTRDIIFKRVGGTGISHPWGWFIEYLKCT